MKPIKPDYSKILFVGIPLGFIAWVVLIAPSVLLARTIGFIDYWAHISLFFTFIFISGYLIFCIKNPLKVGAAIVNSPRVLNSDKDEFQCEVCRKLIAENQTVKIWQKSISGKNIVCCSNCYNKKTNGSYKTIIAFSIIQFCLGIILISYSPEEKIGWILLNLCLILFFNIIMILPHELGHTFVAKSLGIYVLGVVIGIGKTVFVKQYWNMSWEFKSIPIGGVTIPLILDQHKYRRNQFFITLGGPFINLLTIMILLYIYPTTKLFLDIFNTQLAFAAAIFLANIIDLLCNLLPFQVNTITGKIKSDGLSLIMLPFLSKEAVDQRIKNNKKRYSQIKTVTNVTKKQG